MSISVGLSAAFSGLKAAQTSLDVLANNISNAGVEGYTRKILPQETLVAVGGQTLGVQLQKVIRNVDNSLLRDLAKQVSITENNATTKAYLDRIQDFNGATHNNQSISAQISALSTSFIELSNTPDNQLNIEIALAEARETAGKFNDFARLLTDMRNQTEDEISSAIAIINQSLETVANLNVRINDLQASEQSSAALEDQRDNAVRTISKYIQVSSFTAENNKLIVMTRQGQTLADTSAHKLVFQKSTLLPTSFYPGGGAEGIFIDSTSGIEITTTGIGGSMGALLDLRDDVLPTYTAQIDELAHKLAFRFEQQGLRLFTDETGTVPPNVADPAVVGYIGMAKNIRVNIDIENDPTLIRSGTNGNAVLSGSSEVIRKIIDFAFGNFAYEEGRGNVDISAGTLFTSTGMTLVNKITGNTNIAGTAYQPALSAHPDISPGQQFTITTTGAPQTITITAATTAIDLVTDINAALGPIASLNGLGQLALESPSDITMNFISLTNAGIAALGFNYGVQVAQDPTFSVQVGTQTPVSISISNTDTSANLLADLNTIAGITATLNGAGELVITPTEGGDLTLSNTIGRPLADLGVVINNVSHTPFRTTNLGPDASINLGLLGSATLTTFSQSVMSTQAEDHRAAERAVEKELSFLQILDKRNSDTSGVNIDQEMAEMIRIQSNYAAAAKIISVSEKMLDDLLNSIR